MPDPAQAAAGCRPTPDSSVSTVCLVARLRWSSRRRLRGGGGGCAARWCVRLSDEIEAEHEYNFNNVVRFAEICLIPDTSTSVTVLASPNVCYDVVALEEVYRSGRIRTALQGGVVVNSLLQMCSRARD